MTLSMSLADNRMPTGEEYTSELDQPCSVRVNSSGQCKKWTDLHWDEHLRALIKNVKTPRLI